MSLSIGPKVRNLFKGERAQTTTEFVLISPFLFLIFFLIIDFGWMLKNWIVVTNAAREATRCAVAHSCRIDGAEVSPQVLVDKRLTQGITGNLEARQVVVSYRDQNGDNEITDGDSIIVCVKAENDFIGPVFDLINFMSGGGILDKSLPIKAREEMRLEVSPDQNDPAVFDSGTSGCVFPAT